MATPESVVREHTDAITLHVTELWLANARLSKRERDLEARLGDALDEVHSLKESLKVRDQLIEEFRAMNTKARGAIR